MELVKLCAATVLVSVLATAAAAQERGSPEFLRGLKLYECGEFPNAAALFQRVVQGDTPDVEATALTSQFFLAKALMRAGFLHSALALFENIVAQGQHPYQLQVLPWALQLARHEPRPPGALELLGRFSERDVDAAVSLTARDRTQLWALLGEHAYRNAELPRAVALLERVERGSPEYLRAQVLLGVTEVRRRHSRPAIAAFKEVIRSVDDGEAEDAATAQRMRALAWLSLGRVYYTAAYQDGNRHRQGVLVGSAVDAWSRVDETSEYWLDALFESAWALFASNEHARALGNIHALLSPYFRGAFYPEAHLVQAVIKFDSCQMDGAMASVGRFHRAYDPLLEELQGLLSRGADPASWSRLLTTGETQVSSKLSAVLQRALGDRELVRARDELRAIAAERAQIDSATASVARGALGERIRQDLDVARAFAEQRAGEFAQARVQRLADELQEVANQADTVEIEVLNYLRGHIGKQPNPPSAVGRSVVVDSEHVIWPFNGEYWRDELGYYRQALSSRCDKR